MNYLINGIELKIDDIVLFKKKHYAESYEARVTHIFKDNTVRVNRGSNATIVDVSEIQEIVSSGKLLSIKDILDIPVDEIKEMRQNKIPDTIVERILDKKATAASAKPQLQLIPSCFSEELARVMQNGKEKYGERNWITGDGVSLQTYLGAILRHTNKIISGEDVDSESGLEHAAHIAASCAIILDAKKCGKLKDDRILPKCYEIPNPGSPIRD